MSRTSAPVSARASTGRPRLETVERVEPLYNVVLLDDNEHTYEYVAAMLSEVMPCGCDEAWAMAYELDGLGHVVLQTASQASARRQQQRIHSYGRDWRLPSSRGSMTSILVPAN